MYLGGDLSYVNEIEDKGAVFYDKGEVKDPFVIFRERGANIVRVRLWHTPADQYSSLADVKRTIGRAKALGMAVMLDFHYSDWWADPAKQVVPAAWARLEDLAALEHAMYAYTLNTLLELHQDGLMPDVVQVGNEINTEILMPAPYVDGATIRWERNAALINAGLSAVRKAGEQTATQPRAMLHIAQPENIVGWFDEALAAGVTDFDAIGMSYYPKWSTRTLKQAAETMGEARERYQKEVMLVEVAYPWTQTLHLAESHLIAEDCIVPGYPATPQGQRQFLIDLTQATRDHGGTGVIYWEPAWISTRQMPSIWENAALFDYQGAAHEGMEFLGREYS